MNDRADALDRVRSALAGRYTVEREIGRGGMATVYLAEDLKHRRNVAIKVLHADLASAVAGQRFLREIETIARLQHPHIVPLYDSGEVDGILFFAMPYVEGQSLRECITRQGQLPIDDAARITRGVALALDFAHTHGVAHRDVKPENILLVDGLAMVADFGIARAVSAAGGDKLTQSGVIFGTPLYMSPEQASGEEVSAGLGDQYSLACVTYEMLVGAPPYGGRAVDLVRARHLLAPIPRIRRVRPKVPPALESAVEKGMAKLPADRFPSVIQYADAVVAAAKDAPGKGRLPKPVLVALVVALAAAGAVAIAANRAKPTSLPASDVVPRIAVLPFENLGRPDDQFFADGLTDELTTRVAGMSGFEVISHTSAMQYDRRRRSIKQIGQDLGVDYILTGTIRTDRRADGTGRTRVSPELLRVSSDAPIWKSHQDAALVPGELFDVQAAIAESVAVRLKVAILLPERATLQSQPTSNLAAYEEFLRGNIYAASSRSPEPMRLAIDAYERATTLDPKFTLAFARLAQVQSVYYADVDRSPDRQNKARAALERALALDATNPAVGLANGFYNYWVLRDYKTAMISFAAVQASEPSNAELYSAIGVSLRSQGKWKEALAASQKAAELDPRSHHYAFELALSAVWLERFAEADDDLQRAIALNPRYLPPYLTRSYLQLKWRGDRVAALKIMHDASLQFDTLTILAALIPAFRFHLAALDEPWQDALARMSLSATRVDSETYYLAKGELYSRRRETARARTYFDSARRVLEPRIKAGNAQAVFHSDLGFAYAGLGRIDEGVAEAKRAVELVPATRDATTHLYLALALVRVYILVGRYDEAVQELRQQLATPLLISPELLGAHPDFAPLRDLPAFQELLRRRR